MRRWKRKKMFSTNMPYSFDESSEYESEEKKIYMHILLYNFISERGTKRNQTDGVIRITNRSVSYFLRYINTCIAGKWKNNSSYTYNKSIVLRTFLLIVVMIIEIYLLFSIVYNEVKNYCLQILFDRNAFLKVCCISYREDARLSLYCMS